MARLIILGATGSLGRHVLRQALSAGHRVTVLVRAASRLLPETRPFIGTHVGDLNAIAPADLAEIVSGHDGLINCAGHVADGKAFVGLVDRIVSSVELLPTPPVCWFVAGAALLDIDPSGRRGVELPLVKSTYWPHRANLERLARSQLDWRLLCPGPMVEQPALGLERLRTSVDRLPVQVPAFARFLPAPLLLPLFASLVRQMIVPYADAAELMLANLGTSCALARHRVGLALPSGMRGRKSRWASKAVHA